MIVDARHRIDALDGIRAFAIGTVMACHLGYRRAFGGAYGVDVFFALSGFLITSLLLEERSSRRRIDTRSFYARRALRLVPALWCTLAATLLVVALGGLPAQFKWAAVPTRSGAVWVALYLGDFARAYGPSDALGAMGHTWSLGIEEQFYLLWPAAVALACRAGWKRLVAPALAGAFVVENLIRYMLLHHLVLAQILQNSPETHCDGLLLGSALAFWLHGREIRDDGTWCRAAPMVLGGASAVLLWTMWTFRVFDFHFLEFGVPLASLTTTAIIAVVTTRPVGWVNAALASRPVAWVGKRSYGLYLWHFPIFIFLSRPGWSKTTRSVVEVVVSLIVAGLSYRFVELPFLRLKDRFRPGVPATPDPVTLPGVNEHPPAP